MTQFQCRSCGAIESRITNGDNSVCIECGTPDDFEEIEPNENEHRFGDKLGEKIDYDYED